MDILFYQFNLSFSWDQVKGTNNSMTFLTSFFSLSKLESLCLVLRGEPTTTQTPTESTSTTTEGTVPEVEVAAVAAEEENENEKKEDEDSGAGNSGAMKGVVMAAMATALLVG